MIDFSEKKFKTEYLNSLDFKTPYFLISKNKIKKKYKEFQKLFPASSIHYAMKANSEPEALKVLHELGCGFEAASIYELNLLKKIKVPPGKIIYGTAVKPVSQIKDFFAYGVDRFAFDSFPELEKISASAPGSKVYVRMIANDTGSVFKFSEKFGAYKENIVPLLLRAKELGLKPYGISFHVGSQASNPDAWSETVESINPILTELRKMGIELEILNIGGGYPCEYLSGQIVPSLEDISKNVFEQYEKLPYKPKIIMEPGRGLIAESCVVIASVIGRVDRVEHTWLFLDVGCYNGLFETMAYQGSTRYPVASLRQANNSGESLFALAGPTGDSPDIITTEALLPADIGIGEKLIFYNVGAYSLSVMSHFNGFPKPDVYCV